MFQKIKINHILGLLLFTLGVLLSILIPGGPIETRSFSHIDVNILTLFNIFLTILGMGSFIIAYFIYKNYLLALNLGRIFSVFYIVVYILDLFEIFPTSPDIMPISLKSVEIISTTLAVIFILLSYSIPYTYFKKNSFKLRIDYKLLLLEILIAISIIIFATYSAIN